MNDKEIKEMFLKKNKEIIKNKLTLDIDNNIDSLVATMENIIYLEFGIYKEKIFNIDVEKINRKKVNSILNGYQEYLNNKIKELINLKKEACSDFIDEDNLDKGINEYEAILDSTTNDIENKLLNLIMGYIDENIISNIVSEEWYLDNDNKINFYLNEKLGKDIFDKVILQLKDRDKIIYNNAQESYEKYLILNNNIDKE
ncbi:MAG: hypothetical protein ACI4OT_01320 [Bacilli bacterium]